MYSHVSKQLRFSVFMKVLSLYETVKLPLTIVGLSFKYHLENQTNMF